MMFDLLTSDNALLSRPTNEAEDAGQTVESAAIYLPSEAVFGARSCTKLVADNCTRFGASSCTEAIGPAVKNYVQAGITAATRRAYRADIDHFRAWGGDIPTTDSELAAYVAEHATTLKVATLARRLATISAAHEAKGLPNPVRSPLIRATMRGIRREHGSAQRQARPLLRDDLFAVLAATGDGLKDIRDRALLLVGFAGGFRRSELAAITCADIERVRQGLVITLPRSKTDQDGIGRKVGIPHGRTRWCPVAALERWIEAAGIEAGPVFRPVDRHGRISTERLSGEAVCIVVRERVTAAGYDPAGYSGHSLRAGLATAASQAGVPPWRIRQQTGHASDAMLARYTDSG
jgi:integrase